MGGGHTDLLRPLFSSLLLPAPLVLERPLSIWALFQDEGDALGDEDLAPFFPPLLLVFGFPSVWPFRGRSSFAIIVLV